MKIKKKTRLKDTYIYIGFSRNGIKAALVVLLLGAGTVKLASESMTLTTYYPSPSGIYRLLTSTQRTILARDSGNVGVGTNAPGAKLDVAGDVNAEGALSIGQLASDPAVAKNGMLYYNTTLKTFRGYQNGEWTNMLGTVPQGTVCGMRHACVSWNGGETSYDQGCYATYYWWWWWYIEYYYPLFRLNRYASSVPCQGNALTLSVDPSGQTVAVNGCPSGYAGATTPASDVFGHLWWWWWWYFPASGHSIYCVKT
ncbi:MAG: hypothetical protein HY078_04805 [Elusimicrobia bacterium]|nr:hypothetical protein [Elusimicrobiota bacterium]